MCEEVPSRAIVLGCDQLLLQRGHKCSRKRRETLIENTKQYTAEYSIKKENEVQTLFLSFITHADESRYLIRI